MDIIYSNLGRVSQNKKRLLEIEAIPHLIYLLFAKKGKFAFSVKHIPKAHWLQVTSCHTDLFTFTFHLMTLHHFITYLFFI